MWILSERCETDQLQLVGSTLTETRNNAYFAFSTVAACLCAMTARAQHRFAVQQLHVVSEFRGREGQTCTEWCCPKQNAPSNLM
jgi:hypothetical protein